MQVVDVRTGAEVRKGRIAGSVHRPLGSLRPLPEPARPVVFVCQHGPRAVLAAARRPDAWVLSGGLSAWTEQGLPVERTATPPRSIDIALGVIDAVGFSRWRRTLLAQARGRTLDLGAGTGRNTRHFPPGLRPVGLDPDLESLRYLRSSGRGTRAHLVCARAEQLPFRDSTFDSVVATLVLCSVDDQKATAGELRRALKPEGVLLGAEHVVARHRRVAEAQRKAGPGWYRRTGSCRLDRETLGTLRESGFTVAETRNALAGVLRSYRATS